MSGNDDDKQMIEKYVYPIKEWEANHSNDTYIKAFRNRRNRKCSNKANSSNKHGLGAS